MVSLRGVHLLALFYFVFIFDSSLGIPGLGEDCTTPLNEAGECKFLNNCQLVKAVYEKRPVTSENVDFFKKSQCQRDRNSGKTVVCCPKSPNLGSRINLPQLSLLPDWKICGQDTVDKIFGGNEAKLGEFPWLALLGYEDARKKRSFNCGGSLINSRYVITAAHCFYVPGKTMVSVRLGEHDKENDPDCIQNSNVCAPSPKDFQIESKKAHEKYRQSPTSPYDIALIRLSREVEFSGYISPICLPVKNPLMKSKDYTDNEVTVAGWGKTEYTMSSAKKLFVKLKLISRNSCKSTYESFRTSLIDSQICAGGVPGKDSCNGDSGGPLMLIEENSERRKSWYLWGIVSFGPRECGNYPGVYTRIDQFDDWILENIY